MVRARGPEWEFPGRLQLQRGSYLGTYLGSEGRGALARGQVHGALINIPMQVATTRRAASLARVRSAGSDL